MKKKILVIVGPTASGKSDLAVSLAKKFKGEVISADSRQVYKGLDIGTGKVTRPEMKGVLHHLLDITNPRKQFTAADFKKHAERVIRYIVRNNKLPIVVGGTGFYIDTLTGSASLPEVPPNPVLRKELNWKNAEELFKILKKRDPRRAKNIDKHNKVRLIRALEIIEALGKVPRLIRTNKRISPYEFIYIGLKPDDLGKRIEKRVKGMFQKGLLNEIKKLKKSGVSDRRLKEFGFEYYNPTIESVTRGTKQYAKRQMIWFKRNKSIKWFRPEQYKEIEQYANMALLGLTHRATT